MALRRWPGGFSVRGWRTDEAKAASVSIASHRACLPPSQHFYPGTDTAMFRLHFIRSLYLIAI
ncbi:MAG: hypothetical protein AAFP90_17860, partial [Planctomycetota bacterium]